MRLAGKTALVTGASRGIGKAIAELFAAEGATVGLVYNRSKEPAEQLAEKICSQGGKAAVYGTDVGNPNSAEEIISAFVEKFATLDVIVNSAGIIRDNLILRMSPEDWEAVIQTNLNGTFYYCKAAATQMMGKRKGSIVNISSVAAQHSNKGQGNYAASKAGIEALTRTLAVEMAKRQVRVNAIAPGFIETDMTETVRNMAGDKIKSAIPMNRYGQPQDVANVALFLASDESAYITGQVITVDGGLSQGGAV